MKIRKARKKDFDKIMNILITSSILNPKDKDNRALKNYIKDILIKKDFLVLVYELNNDLIGVCVCKLNALRKIDAQLTDIYVLKEYRNKGIGKKLMKNTYISLRKKGVKNLGLYSENNKKTLNFYKKQGFQIGRLTRRCDKSIK